MKELKAERTTYEIERILGEGLTGEVYKAFRIDSRRQTRQLVALKVLKSKIPVHILRQEFQRLMQIDSRHCVQLLGWENLSGGPALVLEYLQGMTLYECLQQDLLDLQLVNEVVAQVQYGLRDLHKAQIVHGDLSYKNIFITHQGVVKLIDFGAMRDGQSTTATPQFMAPEIWQGLSASPQTDKFSLGLIYRDLLNERPLVQRDAPFWQSRLKTVLGSNSLLQAEASSRQMLNLESSTYSKRKLAKKIDHYIRQKHRASTQILLLKKKRSSAKPWLFLIFTAFFTFHPQWESAAGLHHKLSVRSEKWLKVSVNGLPGQYTPFQIEGLRKGKYQLSWKTKQKKGMKDLKLSKDSLFLLQLDDILLR